MGRIRLALCFCLVLLLLLARPSYSRRRRAGKPMDLDKLARASRQQQRASAGEDDKELFPKRTPSSSEQPSSDTIPSDKVLPLLSKVNPYIGHKVHEYLEGAAKQEQISSRVKAAEAAGKSSSPAAAAEAESVLSALSASPGFVHLNVGNLALDFFRDNILDGTPPSGSAPGAHLRPIDQVCYRRVVLTEQVTWEEAEQCSRTVSEECYPIYKTELIPQEVTECNTRFKKVCYLEYTHLPRERTVRICSLQKERDCEAQGPRRCTQEQEMVCERFDDDPDEDEVPDEDDVFPEHHLRHGRHDSRSLFFPPSWSRLFRDRREGRGRITLLPKKKEKEDRDDESTDEEYLDCREYREDDCGGGKGGGGDHCKVQTRVDCRPFGPYYKDQKITRCRQTQRTVCGPEECPLVEKGLSCRTKLKKVAEEVPTESCHMAPEDHCRNVTKLIPKLVVAEQCVDTPREHCETVTLPKTEKRPTVKETCDRQDSDVLVVIGGCDRDGQRLNHTETVELGREIEYYQYIEIEARSRFVNKNKRKPANNYVLVGEHKPYTLPDIAQLPFPQSSAVGGMLSSGPILCGGMQLGELCLKFDPHSDRWAMSAVLPEPRLLAGGAVVPGAEHDEKVFIAGGFSTNGATLKSTVVVAKGGTEVSYGPDLPESLASPCVVALNSSHVFIAGGLSVGDMSYSNRAYLHRLGHGGCVPVQDMRHARASHACAKITLHDGSPGVAVAGGLGYFNPGVKYSTEILDLRTLVWTKGPDLPVPLVGGAALTLNGTALAVGGLESHLVHQLDLSQKDSGEAEWVERRERLNQEKNDFVAVLAPKNMFEVAAGKKEEDGMYGTGS